MKILNIRVALCEVEHREDEALWAVLRYIKRNLKGWDGEGLHVDVGDRRNLYNGESDLIGEAWISEAEVPNAQG